MEPTPQAGQGKPAASSLNKFDLVLTVGGGAPQPEMEKRVDIVDISVLIFLIAVLIFWLYTRKQTVLCTVLLALCY